LRDVPGFRQPHVEAEVTRTIQIVALTRFARMCVPESGSTVTCNGRILKQVRYTVANELASLRWGTDYKRISRQLPICREITCPAPNADGQSTGPPSDSRPSPASDHPVQHGIGNVNQSSAAEWKFVIPVRIE